MRKQIAVVTNDCACAEAWPTLFRAVLNASTVLSEADAACLDSRTGRPLALVASQVVDFARWDARMHRTWSAGKVAVLSSKNAALIDSSRYGEHLTLRGGSLRRVRAPALTGNNAFYVEGCQT